MKTSTYKLTLIEYEVWRNEQDGYEVNNLFTVINDLIVVVDDQATCRDIAKKLHNQTIFKTGDKVKIDFRSLDVVDFWPFIELETKAGKPVGRIEVAEID